MIDRLPILLKQYEEIKAMTQQFFKDPNECLKWCIDHPGQRCRDGDGREIWFVLDNTNCTNLHFVTNITDHGKPQRGEEFNLFHSDLKHFDLTTLRPVKAAPEKPTLDNLAALENWDWFKVTFPSGESTVCEKQRVWAGHYAELFIALSAGWPVEFGRE